MPNTLAHAGAQGLTTRAAVSDIDLKWVYLGCVIPDVPWILRRAVLMLVPETDAHLLQSYAILQASLIGCLIFSAAVALLARKTWKMFAVLGGNSAFHLVLDATQTKWGSGVHFFAPFSWETVNWGLFWPESLPTHVLTVVGLLYIGWHWQSSVSGPPELQWPSIPRLAGIFALLGTYFFGALFLLQEPIEANAHSLEVLHETQDRTGRQVEMDRAEYISTQDGHFLEYRGDRIRIEELEIASPAIVSIKGIFVSGHKVRATKFHVHLGRLRDYPSYLGLALIAVVWGAAALKDHSICGWRFLSARRSSAK